MQLLISPVSPFVRKVRILLREADLMDQVTEVPVATTPLESDPTVLSANPTGKIPALLRNDGPAIYDSRVITRFLNDFADGQFYPETRLWEILTLEATADAIMDAAVLMAYEVRFRPVDLQSDAWLNAQWGKVSRAVTAIDSRWMSHMAGPVNMGQIAVGCALSYLDLRHDARNWRADNAALAAWHADWSQRESSIATKPE